MLSNYQRDLHIDGILCAVTLWSGLKQTTIEKEVPGLTAIVWGVKVVKNLDTGGL